MPENVRAKSKNSDKNGDGSKSKRGKILIAAALILALAIGVVYWRVAGSEAGISAVFKGSEEEKTEALDLGVIVINLADDSSSHYLRVNPVLEYVEDKKLSEELNNKKHRFKDKIISYLRKKKMAEVEKPDSLNILKKDILRALNAELESGEIEKVYFIEYLVQ